MTRQYPQEEYRASGRLISRLTHTLAQSKDWSMEDTMAYIGEQVHKSSDMVYRWQQGKLLPKPEVVEALTRIGRHDADLPREWAKELLDTTNYPHPTNLINSLWGAKELYTIPHRLARPEHRRLIGRQKEMQQLLKYLSPNYAAYFITVDGIGGVGKTALTLDVAYQALKASTGEMVGPGIPTFDAIIFVSAKQNYLTTHGILHSTQVHRTLRKIFQEVNTTLERDDIRTIPVQEQAALVRDALSRQSTLLIVDNLETMEDKQEILSFLYDLPPSVKVVVTTRERAIIYAPIRLEQLSEEAAQELIELQAEEKQVHLKIGEAKMLYQRIGGIPAALVYAIGKRAAGYSLETVLQTIPAAEGDVASFCFQSSVETVRGTPAHLMLMSFALFPRMPVLDALSYVAGLNTNTIAAEDALSQLQLLSLVREIDGRFRMLPLTREYAFAELRKYPEFEREARQRWITWYLDYAKKYGGHDMEEWHIKFDKLNIEWENFLAVFDWCTSNERYDVIKAFWCAEEESSVVDFTTIYGYWDDRLSWLAWLMESAGARGDWLVMLDTIASYAYTLTLMSRYEEAHDLFKRGQKLHPHTQPFVEARLLLNHGYLHIFMENFAEVRDLLDRAAAEAEKVHEPLRTRLLLNIDYNRAASSYWQHNYAAAWEGFSCVMQKANAYGWQRFANYAQNYLADIAIHEGRYGEAEHLLEPGLIMAERNNEKRRTCSYNRSYATLYSKQGRFAEALSYAQQAREGYEHLGAEKDLQKMDDLIKELKQQIPV